MAKQMSKRWRADDRRQQKRIRQLRQRQNARRAARGLEPRTPRPVKSEEN